MASGSFNLSKILGDSKYIYSYVKWSSSKNDKDNKSSVNVKVYVGKSSGSTKPTRCTMNTYVSVSGSTEKSQSEEPGTIQEVNGGQEILVFDKSFEVKHNNDGTKTISISASIGNNDVYHATGSANNLTLDVIPRETDTPALAAAYVEDTVSITLSPKISGAKHSIKMVFGSQTHWLQSNGALGSSEVKLSDKNLTMIIPASYYSEFNGTSKNATLYLYTYNGNTKIGSGKSKTVKISCNPTLCIPIITWVIQDINSTTLALTGDADTVVANASTVLITPTITVSDTDDTTAYITSKKVDNNIFTTNTYTVPKAAKKDFDITVTNSRGVTNSATASMVNIIPYVELTFNIVDLFRPEPTTGEIQLKYDGKYYPGNFKENGENNPLTLIWEYKLTGSDDDYTTGGELSPTINSEKNTYSGDIILGNMFDYTKGYTFRFTYKDSIIDKSITKPVPKGYPIFWWNEDAVHIIGDLYVEGQINPS